MENDYELLEWMIDERDRFLGWELELKNEIKNSKKKYVEKILSKIHLFSNEKKWEMISIIYWNFVEINKKELVAPSGEQNIKKLISKIYQFALRCDECDKYVFVESYQSLKDMRRNKRINLCESCKYKKREQEIKQRNEIELIKNKRINELREMHYRQYLKTDEWKQKRKSALYRAGYACQVCNVKYSNLNVHHRTYERLGNEYAQDLIVLCADCHRIFHEQGKLA